MDTADHDFTSYVAVAWPGLVRTALLLTGDLARAEDLAQTALVRTHRRWSSLRRKDRPDVYVRRVMLNLHRSWWRRHRGRAPDRAPIAWADDLSFAAGEARARVVQQGAAEIRVLDTGPIPCTGKPVLARGAAHDGLTTLEVDLPQACQDPAPEGGSLLSFSRIQAVSYDADGRELGRSPLMLPTDGALPDVL